MKVNIVEQLLFINSQANGLDSRELQIAKHFRALGGGLKFLCEICALVRALSMLREGMKRH